MGKDVEFENRDLRRFHAQLADKVRLIHGERCPCCGYVMVRPRKKSMQNQQRRDRISVAHNRPVGFGGDPTVWVYACRGCNNDQRGRTFEGWAVVLARLGDRRAPLVAALAVIVNAFIERKENGRSTEERVPAAASEGDGAAGEILYASVDAGREKA